MNLSETLQENKKIGLCLKNALGMLCSLHQILQMRTLLAFYSKQKDSMGLTLGHEKMIRDIQLLYTHGQLTLSEETVHCSSELTWSLLFEAFPVQDQTIHWKHFPYQYNGILKFFGIYEMTTVSDQKPRKNKGAVINIASLHSSEMQTTIIVLC